MRNGCWKSKRWPRINDRDLCHGESIDNPRPRSITLTARNPGRYGTVPRARGGKRKISADNRCLLTPEFDLTAGCEKGEIEAADRAVIPSKSRALCRETSRRSRSRGSQALVAAEFMIALRC